VGETFITAYECSRISEQFLAQELVNLGPVLFSQEYQGCFVNQASAAFQSDMIMKALVSDFEPFIGATAL